MIAKSETDRIAQIRLGGVLENTPLSSEMERERYIAIHDLTAASYFKLLDFEGPYNVTLSAGNRRATIGVTSLNGSLIRRLEIRHRATFGGTLEEYGAAIRRFFVANRFEGAKSIELREAELRTIRDVCAASLAQVLKFDGVAINHSTAEHLFSLIFVVAEAQKALNFPAGEPNSRLHAPIDNLQKSIEDVGTNSPTFKPIKSRIRYRSAPAQVQIAERKNVARTRGAALFAACQTRLNEQPQLAKLAESYLQALSALSRRRGTYNLVVAGLEIETLFQIKTQLPPDQDRNVPMDVDLIQAVESLIIAHAGLIALFPDAQAITGEMDRYRQSTEALDALRGRVMDPILRHLSQSKVLLDDDTVKLTQRIEASGEAAPPSAPEPARVSAVKHNWLRGVLSSIGSYLLRKTGQVADDAIKDGADALLKKPDALARAMLAFLREAKDALLALAAGLQSVFGWVAQLLSLFDIE